MLKIFFILFCVLGFQATATEKTYGAFHYTSDHPNTLFFLDDVQYGQSFEFRKALRNHDIQNIVLVSPGGDVAEGLLMAGIIFDKQLRTYIPKDTKCESACSYMFFAGNERLADGKLGVHQTWSSEYNKKQSIGVTQVQTQYTVSEIIGFLNEFGTPQFVYEKMFQDIEMYYFDPMELDKIHSTNFGLERSKTASLSYYANQKIKTPAPQKEPEVKPEPELTKKELVAIIQTRLNEIGCNAGPADGIWGRRTEAAAKVFAKTAGLPTTGDNFLSEDFFDKLAEAPANFCPKIKPKPKKKSVPTLAGSWSGTLYCNGTKYPVSGFVVKKTSTTYAFNMKTADYTYVGSLITTNNGKNFSMDAVDHTRREFRASGIVSSNGRKLNGQTLGRTCPFVFNKN